MAAAKAEPAPTLLAGGIVPPAAQPVNAPLGFAWLEPGRIAGAPLPGAVNDIHHDLVALKRMGITMLITLTERDLPGDVLRQHGLANLHLPIYDHEVPTLAQIQMLLKRMEGLIQRGEVLAVHCLAGRGRTGVVLAAWWVRAGLTAQEALRRVRLIDPRYVQNAEQETFLQSYENMILQKIV
jgi:atypical dual specificity phosphatase